MTQFKFETIRETEKAVLAKVPYYEATSEANKKHKQLYWECWIPKYAIEQGIAKDVVIAKRNEMRLSNRYQRMYQMPNSWKTFGEYAPIKVSHEIETIDEDKLAELVKFYENKYGATLRRLNIDGEGSNGCVSEEDERILIQLEFPSLLKCHVPKKTITIYK